MGILSNNDINSDHELMANFHFPTSKKALIIFTRNPELGKCKTRLAETIGDQAALNVYKHLLQHTAKVAKKVSADRFVFYSEHINTKDLWDEAFFRKKLQEGSHLGEKMHNAFSLLFASGYEKVCIIGSDLLDLNTNLINEAFETLDHHDVVLGPAMDGGYYLLAMNHLFEAVFENKAWGTKTVQNATLEDLKDQKVHLLQELNDIDTFDDMKHYDELKTYYN